LSLPFPSLHCFVCCEVLQSSSLCRMRLPPGRLMRALKRELSFCLFGPPPFFSVTLCRLTFRKLELQAPRILFSRGLKLPFFSLFGPCVVPFHSVTIAHKYFISSYHRKTDGLKLFFARIYLNLFLFSGITVALASVPKFSP